MNQTSTEGRAEAAAQAARPKGRRHPSHPAETARRRAWGREWGQPVHDFWMQRRGKVKR